MQKGSLKEHRSVFASPTALKSLSLSPPSSPLVSDQLKPFDPEEKKKYDREFLLRCRFTTPCMSKPEGLPAISDVVLDKVAPHTSL